MADGTAGGAILGLVEDAAKQLQELIRNSSTQLRRFVEQSLATIDARQKEAEAKLEAATQAAEERARKAADDALARMQAEMDALRDEMQTHKDEIDSVRGLSGKRLNIAEAVGGFDFDGDGEPDGDGQVYYEPEQREAVAQVSPAAALGEPRWSAEELRIIAGHLAEALREGTLTIAQPGEGSIIRNDSPYMVLDRDLDEITMIGLRGDETSFEEANYIFRLRLIVQHLVDMWHADFNETDEDLRFQKMTGLLGGAREAMSGFIDASEEALLERCEGKAQDRLIEIQKRRAA